VLLTLLQQKKYLNSASIQFHTFRFEDISASSKVFMFNLNTNKSINKDSISFTVHPVPAPFSTKALNSSNNKEGGKSQKDTLFKRGNQIFIK
jgi:hypothetical protein